MKVPAKNYHIQINNESGRRGLPLAALKKNAAAMLHASGLPRAALTVILTSDSKIKRLNKRYLRHDRPTDVIAFGQLEGEGPVPLFNGRPFLGDIVISVDTARRQAREYGNTFFYELHFYLCHGLLHLFGFLDKTRRERERMHRIQGEILRSIGLPGR